MTTPTAWPTQLTLPGQAAAPAGPVDMRNMYLFHHAFRRDLDRFCAAVRGTPVDDRRTWGLLARRWGLFADQLHHHHEAEDRVLWPWLLERTTPEEQRVLAEMEREHEAVDPALTAVTDGFGRLAGHADEDARAALSVRLVGLREGLDRHLAHEEVDAMAILQRVTTPADWAALEKRLGEGQPPTVVLTMLPWVAYGIPPATLRGVLADAPPPMRWLLRLLGPRFARREAAAFAHA